MTELRPYQHKVIADFERVRSVGKRRILLVLKHGEKRRTVAFTVNVGHSIHLKEEFVKSGGRAEHIDATTPKAEREATLARLASGEIES